MSNNDYEYKTIREILDFARSRNVEITRITVSQELHKVLSDNAALSCNYEGGPTKLWYGLVEIDKKPCKGCCEHDS